MTPMQRKLLIALASFWQQWGSAPDLSQLAKEAQMSKTVIYREVYVLASEGLLILVKRAPAERRTLRGEPPNIAPQLTRKAEELLPRLRELM